MLRSNVEPTSWVLGLQVCVFKGVPWVVPGSSEFESHGSRAAVMFHVNGHLTVLSLRSARRAAANQNVLECGAATSRVGVGGQASAGKAGAHLCGDARPGPRSTGAFGQHDCLLPGCRAGGGVARCRVRWNSLPRPAPWGCPVVSAQ